MSTDVPHLIEAVSHQFTIFKVRGLSLMAAYPFYRLESTLPDLVLENCNEKFVAQTMELPLPS